MTYHFIKKLSALGGFLLTSAIFLLTSSCANYKDVAYFQNAKEYMAAQSDTLSLPSDIDHQTSLYDMTIKPKDQLDIFVFSSESVEAVKQFNALEDAPLNYGGQRTAVGTKRFRYYLVDNEGNIDFPVLGKVHLAGFTIEQANQHLKEKIAPYIKEGIHYRVNTQIGNFEVAVMGEVKSPDTYTTKRNKLTVLEALAMAGDMTIYGKRDNVKVLREVSDGTYEVHELDMRDANILNSPYYYLQQRDIVYVEPNIAMAQNAKIGQTTQLWIRGASVTISLGSLLYMVLK